MQTNRILRNLFLQFAIVDKVLRLNISFVNAKTFPKMRRLVLRTCNSVNILNVPGKKVLYEKWSKNSADPNRVHSWAKIHGFNKSYQNI